MSKLTLTLVLACLSMYGLSYSQVKSDDIKGSNARKQKGGKPVSTVGIRYMIDDVPAAINFYTTHLGFVLELDASPAFASVSRDGVKLLLSGKASSGRRAMPDGSKPVPGGWNRIHIQVEDLDAEVKRLREAGLKFRNEIIKGPGGAQVLLDDPSGNPVELFEPANTSAAPDRKNLQASEANRSRPSHALAATASYRRRR